jgi:hypothetical protein
MQEFSNIEAGCDKERKHEDVWIGIELIGRVFKEPASWNGGTTSQEVAPNQFGGNLVKFEEGTWFPGIVTGI